MRVIVKAMIYCDEPQHVYKSLRKEFDTDIALVPGMHLEDAAWPDDEVEIVGASVCPDEPYLMLALADQPEHFPNKEACAKREEQLQACGWS
ncbi:MAG: hypothetical protein HQ523_00020 [Lentisphaerae bacterium]|nr:hypothetical protein [Lentisphaerota bacterium]